MSSKKRSKLPSMDGFPEAAVEIERLREKVVREKSQGDPAVISRISRMWDREPWRKSNTRLPNGEIDFREVFRYKRERLEELDNMSQDEFDTDMAIEALSDEV